MYRYEGEDRQFVKKGAVLIVDRSLEPRTDDLLIVVADGEMSVLPFAALTQEGEVSVEGIVTCVLNQLR